MVHESDLVAVVPDGAEFGLVTRVPVTRDARLLTIAGLRSATPTRYSVQVGPHAHVDALDGLGVWRYLNHSCEPSVYIRELNVYAMRDLPAGEAMTFDYHTTEWELATPFTCRCGSAHCVGEVRGYAHLPAAVAARLDPWIAPHLRTRARDERSTA